MDKAFRDDKKDDSGNTNKQNNKNQNKNKNNDDITVNFEVDSGSSLSNKKPRRGTANPFNNPVTIRHGR